MVADKGLPMKLAQAQMALMEAEVLLQTGGKGDEKYRKDILEPAAAVLRDLLVSQSSSFPSKVTEPARMRLKSLIMDGSVQMAIASLEADDAFSQPKILEVVESARLALKEARSS